MADLLHNARQKNPGESWITFLLTLGIAAPYFQQEILQYLNLTEWKNLRLANKRHNDIVKHLQTVIFSRCKSWRMVSPQPDSHGPMTADPSNALAPVEAPAQAHLPSWYVCNVCWPKDNIWIQPCTGLQGRLKGRDLLGPCSEVVCKACADSAVHVGVEYLEWLNGTRFRMQMCETCQAYEASRYPYGFRSCMCNQNLGPRDDRGWRCHGCLATACLLLKDRAIAKFKTVRCLRKTREGEIGFDRQLERKANKGQASFDRPVDGDQIFAHTPCPCCAGKLSPRWALPNNDWRLIPEGDHPTVRYCLACDGIVVKPTHGDKWIPSALAQDQPLHTSDRIMARNMRKPALKYAILNPEVVPQNLSK